MGLCTLLAITIALKTGSELPQQETSKTKQPETRNEKLRQELLNLMREDQDARRPLVGLYKLCSDPEEIKRTNLPAVKHLDEIDHRNTKRMKEVVKQCAWPGKSLVSTDGAHAAWILVQHADHDRPFQKQCLELLKAAVKNGEATGEQLAYLTDRVRVGEKQKQIYGTQVRLVDGKLQPCPLEDEANVDKRRKEVGLMPLAAYLRFCQWAMEQSGTGKAGSK